MAKIKLGDIVKDRISGFTGIVIARTEWLYGCTGIGVKPTKSNKLKDDGTPADIQWFDEPSLTATAKKAGGLVSGGGPSNRAGQ